MPFEYWKLPASYDETTRIVNCYKSGKYIIFTRDDGKECKYDLSTGEILGFRGKPVKSLQSQLKDLTCERLIFLIKDPIYKSYLEYIWKWHPNGKAWVFFQYTMPDYRDYEQYFTSGFTNIENRFKYGYSEIPKGLFKFCKEFDIKLTNKLAKSYISNPNAFNLLYKMDFAKCSVEQMIEAMIYGCTMDHYDYYVNNTQIINEDDLLLRREEATPPKNNVILGRNSYFISLINECGYNAKLLFNYIDSVKIARRFKKTIFQDVYDYADMMMQLYDNYDRYPENFSKAHSKACEEYNRISKEYDEIKYSGNYVERNVLEYECEIDGFKFIYPRKTSDIKKEGISQHNCVATYINRVLSENCHIMFMRPVDNIEESYITLEIRNNQIVQAKRKYNDDPSKEERKIIEKWNEKYKDFKLT